MPDNTIELRATLRDEVSKALGEIHNSLRRFDRQATTRQATGELRNLETAAYRVGREIGATLRLLGAGSVVGGGFVASLTLMSRSLADFARSGLQTHYAAQEIGLTAEQLERLARAGELTGQTHEQAANNLQNALSRMRDLSARGQFSNVWQELAKLGNQSGIAFYREFQNVVAGPEGAIGGFKFVAERVQKLIEEGRPAAAKALADIFGMGSVGWGDALKHLKEIGQVITPDIPLLQRYQLSYINLGTAMDNIKATIAMAFMPAFTNLTKRLGEWLKGEDGQKLTEVIAGWGKALEEANWGSFTEWLKTEYQGLTEVVSAFGTAFKAADEVVQAMDLTWPQVIGGLVAIKFSEWLLKVALGLEAINKFKLLFPMLPMIAAAADVLRGPQTPEEARERKETAEEKAQETLKEWMPWFEKKEERPTMVPPEVLQRKEQAEEKAPEILKLYPWFRPGGMRELWDRVNPFNKENIERERQQPFKFTDMLAAGDQIRFKPDLAWAGGLSGEASTNIEDRRVRRELIDEFEDLHEQLQRINDLLMPAGPGGGGAGGGGAATFGGGAGGGAAGGVPGLPGGPSGPAGTREIGGISPQAAMAPGSPTGAAGVQGLPGSPSGPPAARTSGINVPGGADIAGRMTWFNPYPYTYTNPQTGEKLTDWSAMRLREGPHASGLPISTPGFASPGRAGLGGWYELTMPDGRKVITQKTDVGPRGVIDINAALRSQLYPGGKGYREGPISGRYLGRTRPLTRALAEETGGPIKGNAEVDVNVKAPKSAVAGEGENNLFRRHRIQRAPQMGNTGGDGADYSNFNYE